MKPIFRLIAILVLGVMLGAGAIGCEPPEEGEREEMPPPQQPPPGPGPGF